LSALSPCPVSSWPVAIEPSTPALMRKRPEPQLFPEDRPQPRQPLRLDDQKKHDQRAEGHEFEMRDHCRRERDAEHARQLVEEDRQDRDEGGTEKTAENRAEPTDHHHEQELER